MNNIYKLLEYSDSEDEDEKNISKPTITNSTIINNKVRKNKFNFKYQENRIKLWYDENSWQYKLITDQYVFNDNSSVLEKYDLLYLKSLFINEKNNFIKNKCYIKLMLYITNTEWNIIKNLVTIRKK